MPKKRKKKKPSTTHSVPGPHHRKPPKRVKMIDLAALRRYIDEADSSAGQSHPRHEGD